MSARPYQLLFSFTRLCSSGSQISSPPSPLSNLPAPRPAERVTASPRLFFFRVPPRRHHAALLTRTAFVWKCDRFFEWMVLVLMRPSVAAGQVAAAMVRLNRDMPLGWCRVPRISMTRR